MINENDAIEIANYRRYFRQYRAKMACQQYKEALRDLDTAIINCPVSEALDYLATLRSETARLAEPPPTSFMASLRRLFTRGRS